MLNLDINSVILTSSTHSSRGTAVFYHNNPDKVAREDNVKNLIKRINKPKYKMIFRVVKTNNKVRKYLKCKKKINEKNLPSD